METTDWERAAEAVARLVEAMETIGIEARVAELWGAAFEAALANVYEGTEEIPEGLLELRARCSARIVALSAKRRDALAAQGGALGLAPQATN